MLMRIFNYHRYKLPVILLFTTFFLVSCGGSPDGNAICLWPFPCPSVDYSGNPKVLAGIDASSISASISEPKVTYVNSNIPIVEIPVGTKGSLSKPLIRQLVEHSVYWKKYHVFKFESQPGQSEKKHVVLLYTDEEKEGADYLHFGVWLTVPEQAADKHPIVTFASGNSPFKEANIAKLPSATYKGTAVGFYGKRATGSETSKVAPFTAKASLTATFGVDGKVNGEVTDFITENGEKPKWMVKLISDNKLVGASFGGTTQISETDKNGDLMGEGLWNGKFYGNEKSAGHLGSVAGKFNVQTSRLGNDLKDFLGIVGAFGAKKMPSPSAQ